MRSVPLTCTLVLCLSRKPSRRKTYVIALARVALLLFLLPFSFRQQKDLVDKLIKATWSVSTIVTANSMDLQQASLVVVEVEQANQKKKKAIPRALTVTPELIAVPGMTDWCELQSEELSVCIESEDEVDSDCFIDNVARVSAWSSSLTY